MLKADFLDGSSDDVATAITSDTGEEFTFSEVLFCSYNLYHFIFLKENSFEIFRLKFFDISKLKPFELR